jgi:5-methyltetrahydrofolate--homocysteine methyltransferase
MADYQDLQNRIDGGEVIILDGAIGTQLQAMGVPMHPICWCAEALYTHPYTVIQMHERYIRAGVDIITTNTFSTTRAMLEPAGYGAHVRELNARAVYLAREAIARAGGKRSVYIAGSISNHVAGRIPQTGVLGPSIATHRIRSDDLQSYYQEVADVLAEAGVDFFLLENMRWHNESRVLAIKAAQATGLPVWCGFTGAKAENDPTVRLCDPAQVKDPAFANDPRVRTALADAIDEIAPLGVSVMSIFHTTVPNMEPALKVMLDNWSGPVGAYCDASRTDYTTSSQDKTIANVTTPEQHLEEAKKWVQMGAQIIGTCCGFGVEYIEPLREGLPTHIPSPRPSSPEPTS